MSAQEVRDHLDDRFRLLSGSARGPQHHQTLHAAVSWSYDLLEDDERNLLDRCSVFAGGFDVAAAVHVCADARMDRFAVLDLLDSLVRKSLVTAEPLAGQTRYGLLETIRQFGEEQLDSQGDHRRGAAPPRVRTSRPRPRPRGGGGTDRSSVRRSTGWSASSPTFGPASDGPPTTISSPSPSRSRPTPPCSRWCCSGSSPSAGPRSSSPEPPRPTFPSCRGCTRRPASAR